MSVTNCYFLIVSSDPYVVVSCARVAIPHSNEVCRVLMSVVW